MARIVFGSYFVRYPLGGNMSSVLQYLVGFQKLGHEVFLVEKSGYPDSCFDPSRKAMSDDCSYGVRAARELLARFGLEDHFCYVDAQNRYHGLAKQQIEAAFRSADVYFECGTHEAWTEESSWSGLRVLVDNDPGFAQIDIEGRRAAGQAVPDYDHYVTNGLNIGTPFTTAPAAGQRWLHCSHPVVTDLFPVRKPPLDAPFTTRMNWVSYGTVQYQGRTYGHKDVEFQRFLDLPRRVPNVLELAVAGASAPRDLLAAAGWRLSDPHQATVSFDSYLNYLSNSFGEFGVCKNGFVALNTGWFSDRNAAYLASGRPVVLQDTGFSRRLPCGRGLFAVNNVEEAADAIRTISGDYDNHSRWAREIAREYLEATTILGRMLREIGI